MVRWSGLQGFTPTKYRRYLKKGEWELRFTKSGFYYRPWYQLEGITKSGEVKYLFTAVPDDSGEEQFILTPPEKSFDEEIESGEIRQGDPTMQGYFNLAPFICGEIVKTPTVEDDRTGIKLSSMDGRNATPSETNVVVKADKSAVIDLNLKRRAVTKLSVKKDELYNYTLRGMFPSEWNLWGPFDPQARNATFNTAVIAEMQKEAEEFAKMAMAGALDEQKMAAEAVDNSIDM